MTCPRAPGSWHRVAAVLTFLLMFQTTNAGSLQGDLSAPRIVALDQGLAAVHRDTISPIWTAPGGLVPTEPVAAENGLVVGAGSTVYRLSTPDGGVEWQVDMPGRVFEPTVLGHRVFVGTEGRALAALDLGSGAALWSVDIEGWIYPPAVAGNAVLVTGRSSMIRAFNRDSGARLWESALPNEAVYRPVHTALAGVIVTTFSGHIIAVDPSTGHTMWSLRESVAQHSPLAVGDVLVFRGFDGIVTARSQIDGHVLWRSESGAADVQLTGDDRHVVLFNDTADIRLLRAASGRELGVYPVHGAHVEHAWVAGQHLLALYRGGFTAQPRPIRVQQWAINPSEERSP